MGGFTSPGAEERSELLREIGVESFDELIEPGIPGDLCCRQILNLPKGKSEQEVYRELSRLASRNTNNEEWNSFLGAGAYDHFVPAATSAITSRSEFLTAYTPYQAEVSQGTLQAIYEYQSLICELTGFEVSNASMYDGATALAEAVIMAQAVHKKGTSFIIPASLNPLYKQVLLTYMKGLKISLIEAPMNVTGAVDIDALKKLLTPEVFGVAIQSPNFFGVAESMAEIAELKRISPFVLVASVDPLSLALLEAPAKLGVDIVVGEAHYFASGVSFGGPLLGFMATGIDHLRQMPGRIVGKTVDRDGKRGFVLTAQTREQHIRREKATSNICSNEGLLALGATISLSLIGKEGFRKMALLNLSKTQYAIRAFQKNPKVSMVFSGPVFNEFTLEVKGESLDTLFARAEKRRIVPGLRLDRLLPLQKNRVLICITEKKSQSDIDALVELFA